jgi:hypothetical protein
MSEKKYWDFAKGWYGQKGANMDVISVAVKEDADVQIVAIHKESGTQIALDKFFLKRNVSKDRPNANPAWPDWTATFTTED